MVRADLFQNFQFHALPGWHTKTTQTPNSQSGINFKISIHSEKKIEWYNKLFETITSWNLNGRCLRFPTPQDVLRLFWVCCVDISSDNDTQWNVMSWRKKKIITWKKHVRNSSSIRTIETLKPHGRTKKLFLSPMKASRLSKLLKQMNFLQNPQFKSVGSYKHTRPTGSNVEMISDSCRG